MIALVAEHDDEIGHAGTGNAAFLDRRSQRNASHRCIFAVGPAVDADLLGVGDALRNEILGAIGNIVLYPRLHLKAPAFSNAERKPADPLN